MTQNSCRGAANVVGVVFVGQGEVEGIQRTLAAFVVLERVDCGDPGFEGRVAEFLDDVEEVFVQLVGEFGDVLIDV